jgi:hypothetical protein
LKAAREVELEVALDDPSDAALPALAVDADDGFVGAADVLRIEGEVGDDPWGFVCCAFFCAFLEAFLDCVLVGAGECADDQLTAIPYGARGCTGILFEVSTMSMTEVMSEKSIPGCIPWV